MPGVLLETFVNLISMLYLLVYFKSASTQKLGVVSIVTAQHGNNGQRMNTTKSSDFFLHLHVDYEENV